MKTYFFYRRPLRWGRQTLSLLLVLMILVSQPLRSFAAETTSGETDADISAPFSPADESGASSEIPDSSEDSALPAPAQAADVLADTPDETVSTPAEEPAPSPQPVKYIVTFDMGTLGTQTEEVEENQLPQNIPTPEKATYTFLYWTDSAGNVLSPNTVPVTANTTYYAKFGRKLSDLLNTVHHIAYVKGYENGLFLPNKGITRAEVAQMFYSLLLSKSGAAKSFIDVGTQWYANPVGILAGLGIIDGYKNGSFKPNSGITREEFVKMAVCFDTLDSTAAVSFSDVGQKSWSAPYIATAFKKGWVLGYGNNLFKPGEIITRAEAVTIINRMLGRTPDPNIKKLANTKNFYDLYPSFWAYGQILEAAMSHEYVVKNGTETWTSYTQDTSRTSGHWIYYEGKSYYVDPATQKLASGEITIGGKQYYFDPATRTVFTGFRYVSGWKRYFKNGILLEDISGLGLVSGPYYIKVYKPGNYLIVYAKDGANGYTIPVKAMLTSCGNSTPTGTYYTPAKFRWLKMVGDSWAQWCTQISGNYLFHSVPNWTYNNRDLEVSEYNQLGTTRSLGCIRLNCANAKWIYDNCGLGTQVYITPYESSGILAKPAALQIPSWHSWDPTDPTAYYLCRQYGCH